MTYYYIYKITCTEGSFKDKIYFGQHTTNNLNDNYKGSGKLITQYYKKYPNDYKKEILAFYNSSEELNNAEYELIKPHLGKEYCLNLRDGGNQSKPTEEIKQRISNTLKGTHRKEETKQKIGITLSKQRKGKGNPIYGKHRVWNADHTKFIFV